jgi:hypothetical protein
MWARPDASFLAFNLSFEAGPKRKPSIWPTPRVKVVPFLAFLFGSLVSMYLVGRVAEFLQGLLREGLLRKDREWEGYEDYLQSRTWRKKRQAAVERSGG